MRRERNKNDYLALVDICHKSKNLYNCVNYILRQCRCNKLENIPEYRDLVKSERKVVKSKKDGTRKEYIQNLISEYDLSKRMSRLKQADYVSLKAQVSQQTIALIFKNHKGFRKSVSDYSRNPSKYKGKPKLPRYKDKDGLNVAVFTNQCSTIDKNGYLKLSKELTLKSVRTTVPKHNFRQIRIIPKLDYFKIEIVYDKTESEYAKQARIRNKKTNNAAIDIGVDNLATITSDNMDSRPLIVNGRSLKSVNNHYNKRIAKLNQTYSKQDIHSGRKLRRLNSKRGFIIEDYMHKASRRIVDFCILNDVGTLYVGHNNGWKQNCNMSRRNNQNFVQIPFDRLIQKLKYKCGEVGINVVLVNEAYSSKCSFLDGESVGKHDSYKGKRVDRGTFKSYGGRTINADVNGSLNILKLGTKRKFKVSNKVFNPARLSKIDGLNDVAHFKWQPVDIGCVFQPDSLTMNSGLTIKDFQ